MNTILRRRFLQTVAVTLASTPSLGVLAADAFPSKPIKILVGYSAGGAVDAVARALGQQHVAVLGQPVIVENKPGAGTNIAVKSLTTSPPDGYTLLLAANALAANPALYKPAPFDLDRDFTPIALVGRVPVVFAVREGRRSRPCASWSRRPRPGRATSASRRRATARRRTWRWSCSSTRPASRCGTCPYKGGAQALTDVWAATSTSLRSMRWRCCRSPRPASCACSP